MSTKIFCGSNGVKVSNGNTKIGHDTLISNICSATDCPSRKMGVCKAQHVYTHWYNFLKRLHLLTPKQISGGVKDICYALKAERMYSNCLPYRREQEVVFDYFTVDEIVMDLVEILGSHRVKPQYVRMNESGDFRTQDDVHKVERIAERLPRITFYMYTSRDDLDFSKRPNNLIINGTTFMIDNAFIPIPKVMMPMVEKFQKKSKTRVKCAMNCRKCNLCKTKGGKLIYCPIH